MSGFDPGPEWREWSYEAPRRDSDQELLVWQVGHEKKSWVREAPVPPLPTEALAALDGADLIFVSDVLRALGKWKQGRS